MPIHGVAVTVPEPWGAQLQSARKEFGDPMADAIPPHVTLLPPTPIEADVADAFHEHLLDVCGRLGPFEMVLSGTGTFRPVSPVVFVQVSSGLVECEILEQGVRSGPVERTLEFPYHPHITVAHHLDDDALDRAFDELVDFRCEFVVGSLELYHHDSDGVWRVVRSYPLTGPSAG